LAVFRPLLRPLLLLVFLAASSSGFFFRLLLQASFFVVSSSWVDVNSSIAVARMSLSGREVRYLYS